GFAEETVSYPLRLRCAALCEGLHVRWMRDGASDPLVLEVLRPGEHLIEIPWRPASRGWQCPGRLRLMSTAPLGLFICWTVWEPSVPQPIVPARKPGPVRERMELHFSGVERGGADRPGASGDKWHDLRPRRPQDSPSRLAWKLMAQGRGALVKRFTHEAPGTLVVALDPSRPREEALQHLSERLCQLHRQGIPFGLLWNGQVVGPDEGLAHRDRCLMLLAEAS
ncbi:MAG: DUF58 domain-containing protein, partial [Cyanobacteriota bacterium]|nr:DUF58 domain-containing protein [Cyanobacteriota bacterium]